MDDFTKFDCSILSNYIQYSSIMNVSKVKQIIAKFEKYHKHYLNFKYYLNKQQKKQVVYEFVNLNDGTFKLRASVYDYDYWRYIQGEIYCGLEDKYPDSYRPYRPARDALPIVELCDESCDYFHKIRPKYSDTGICLLDLLDED